MSSEQIDSYQKLYDELPFEETMAAIRKKTVLKFLSTYNSKTLLEIGCGNDSIVNHYRRFENAIIVEPSKVFFERLRHLKIAQLRKVVCVNDFFSAELKSIVDFGKVDAILVSALLHEVPSPEKLLNDIFEVAPAQTVIHINVPNANSFHRLLALEASLIKDVNELSAQQIKLNQLFTFNLTMLEKLVTSCGFKIIEKGSFFIKPFTHLQMHHIKNHELFNDNIILGLENMIKYFPDNGAEIFVNAVKL